MKSYQKAKTKTTKINKAYLREHLAEKKCFLSGIAQMRGGGLARIKKYTLSSPRAKRAGPKGPRAESARAVTGRRCPHSGVGEDFSARRPGSPHKNGRNSETKSRTIDPKVSKQNQCQGLRTPL